MSDEQFEGFLTDDLSWRKKEISELFLLASETEKETLLKSLILILYAHWEGYIKKSSKLYLKYVVEKKVKLQELTPNFRAIALKDSAKRCFDSIDSLSLANEFKFIEKYNGMENKKFKIAIDPDDDRESSIIDTGHNLKPKVFKNIINIIGFEYSNAFETREIYINNNLLHMRNTIGHGGRFDEEREEVFSLNINDISRLKEFILTILDFFKDTLLDYIDKQFFLACNEEKKRENNIQLETYLHNRFKEIETR